MTKRQLYLENLSWIRELADDAHKHKRWMEAYLLTYSKIELGLILLFDHRMTMTARPKWAVEFFKHVTAGKHRLSELIDLFCILYGDDLFHDLTTVRKERNDLSHAFYKRKKVDFDKYIEDLYLGALVVDNELAEVVRKEIKRGSKYLDKDRKED